MPPDDPRKLVRLESHAQLLEQLNTDYSPTIRIAPDDESIAYLDDQIAMFLDALKQRGIDQHTLVVITSDHGELLGEHGLYEHQKSLYRPLIQVPLIFWQPGHLPAGVRIKRPISNVSLAATIMDMLSLNDGPAFPGPSLLVLGDAP